MTPSTPDHTKTKFLVDSNVWISALVFGGSPRQVFESVVQEGLRLVVSAEILTEIRRVLAAKFPDFLDDVETLLEVLRDHIDTVPLGFITIEESRDPDDNRVLETAILGKAATIISGDKDIFVLRAYEGAVIMTTHDWLERQSARP